MVASLPLRRRSRPWLRPSAWRSAQEKATAALTRVWRLAAQRRQRRARSGKGAAVVRGSECPALQCNRVVLEAFFLDRACWRVRAEDGTVAHVRSASLEVDGVLLCDPVASGPHKASGQAALFCRRAAMLGEVLCEEAPVLLAAPGPQQLEDAVRAFFALPRGQRDELLQLQASASVLVDVQDSLAQAASPFASQHLEQSALTLDALAPTLDRAGLEKASVQERLDALRFVYILQENGFRTEAGLALFRKLSRVNHSCAPNAMRVELDVSSQRPHGGFSLVALQPIDVGEEITINYGSDEELLMPAEARQEWYMKTRGHGCWCARCDEPEDTLRAFACSTDGCRGYLYVCRGSRSTGTSGEALTTCSACACDAGATAAESLVAEAGVVSTYWKLDCILAAAWQPESVVPVTEWAGSICAALRLRQQAAEVLSDQHWVVARLDGRLSDVFGTGVGPSAVLRDMGTAANLKQQHLAFWDRHLRRPSLKRACDRAELVDLLRATGNDVLALATCRKALAELRCVQPTGAACLRRLVRKKLQICHREYLEARSLRRRISA